MDSTFSARINEALSIRGMKAADLVEITGISKARISQYVNGIYTPKSKATYLIAQALNVSEPWLMGLDVPMERQSSQKENVPQQPAQSPKDVLIEKIIQKLRNLPEERLQEALNYLAYLAGQEK